jgi:hypothetical protein
VTAFVTLPFVILAAALVFAASHLHGLHVQADRENAAAEPIVSAHRLKHQQRLERVRPQAPGRHRLRDTPLA